MSSILYKCFITCWQDFPPESGSMPNFFEFPQTGSDQKKEKHRPILWLIIGLLVWGINCSMKIVHTQPISHIIIFRVPILYITRCSNSKGHAFSYKNYKNLKAGHFYLKSLLKPKLTIYQKEKLHNNSGSTD